MYNVLFLTTRFPYSPDDRGKIDTLSNLKFLSKNYNVFLFYIGNQHQKQNELKQESGVKEIYNYSKDVKNKMINIVFIDHFHMAYYGKLIKKDFTNSKLFVVGKNPSNKMIKFQKIMEVLVK